MASLRAVRNRPSCRQTERCGTPIFYIGLAMSIIGFLLKVNITYLLENAGA